jgi:hypothetical protein
MTTFKKLVGKRVLLNKPTKPESKIQLSPEAEASAERELMAKWTALEVHAVGDEVDLCHLQPGDKVYVETYALQSAGVVQIDGNFKLMVAERDIAIIW